MPAPGQATEPRHGDVRNHRVTVSRGRDVIMTAPDGRPVYSGPLATSRSFEEELYCAACREWFVVRGIIGVLGWGSDHAHGRAKGE